MKSYSHSSGADSRHFLSPLISVHPGHRDKWS